MVVVEIVMMVKVHNAHGGDNDCDYGNNDGGGDYEDDSADGGSGDEDDDSGGDDDVVVVGISVFNMFFLITRSSVEIALI